MTSGNRLSQTTYQLLSLLQKTTRLKQFYFRFVCFSSSGRRPLNVNDSGVVESSSCRRGLHVEPSIRCSPIVTPPPDLFLIGGFDQSQPSPQQDAAGRGEVCPRGAQTHHLLPPGRQPEAHAAGPGRGAGEGPGSDLQQPRQGPRKGKEEEEEGAAAGRKPGAVLGEALPGWHRGARHGSELGGVAGRSGAAGGGR